MALEDLKPDSRRKRLWLDGEKQPVTAIVEAPVMPTTERKKMGRPPMAYAQLSKWVRLKRQNDTCADGEAFGIHVLCEQMEKGATRRVAAGCCSSTRFMGQCSNTQLRPRG